MSRICPITKEVVLYTACLECDEKMCRTNNKWKEKENTMKYREVYRDLFDYTAPKPFLLAHCISADFGMGAGIAVQFNKYFDMKNFLQKKYPDFLEQFVANGKKGTVICERGVCNLITKERVWQKPTYESLQEALDAMKAVIIQNNTKYLAMPLIGCGIDGLDWKWVSKMVKDTFADTDVSITVCRYQP